MLKQTSRQRSSARIEARQGAQLPQWQTPTRNNEERRLLASMIDHLHSSDDVTNPELLRYLLREYQTISTRLNTVQVLRRVQTRLSELKVPFLQFDTASRRWQYWNDYTMT